MSGGGERGVCVVGAGAIGSAVAEAIRGGRVPGARLAAVLRSASTAAETERAIAVSDLVVEAASVAVARELIPRVTRCGKDVVVCSGGVFAEYPCASALIAGPGRVLLPTGALGGFDILAAAARAGTAVARVRHTTIKRPAALGAGEGVAQPREVFRGSAREAALRFPRTSNSSVTLALATLGLDRVEVVVVADPAATCTRHVVEWESPLGRYELRFENAVDPSSGGRTSAVTAWSVIEVLAALARGAGPGVVVLEPRAG
ncbi:aspartate dehydrogenase domain-containing protein [Pseudonocardia thermophila]|nr:aspartate dehydrogenase domain-containing protein [Pseudonocardia thermophila]